MLKHYSHSPGSGTGAEPTLIAVPEENGGGAGQITAAGVKDVGTRAVG